MNKKEIISAIQSQTLLDAHWRYQDSNSQSLLFYQLKPGQEETLVERLRSSKFGICIVSSPEDFDFDNCLVLKHDDWLSFREEVLDLLYPLNANLQLLGVTGTNGKTTTTDLVRQLCLHQSIDILTIGTLGLYINDKKVKDFSLTTPDYIDIRKSLCEKEGIACLELSSHALDQKRFGALKFEAIAWTSFTQDHLDYHRDMESYFKAKLLCFDYLSEKGVVYIPESQKDLRLKLRSHNPAVSKNIKTEEPFLKVSYNQENFGLAVSLLNHLEIKVDESLKLSPTPGRFNLIEYKNSFIVIDFAHSPGGLESLGREIKKSFEDYEIITLFGCGGDRDRSKRSLMGKAASQFSDALIVTSDNPRTEDPEEIIDDIIPGISIDYERQADRVKAIAQGLKLLGKKNCILVIAGKGHEAYIDIDNKKIPYSDHGVVRKWIDAHS